eukprot:6878969-Prymnesium_polylepis.1
MRPIARKRNKPQLRIKIYIPRGTLPCPRPARFAQTRFCVWCAHLNWGAALNKVTCDGLGPQRAHIRNGQLPAK